VDQLHAVFVIANFVTFVRSMF